MKSLRFVWVLLTGYALMTGAVRLSADPFMSWVQRSPSFSDITFGNGMFVGVGGGVYSSTDGADWVYRGLSSGLGLYTVTYGEGKFIAVGSYTPHLDAETSIAFSDDGENWQFALDEFHPNRTFGSIAYGNGIAVATGRSAGPLYWATNFQGFGPYWTQAAAGLLSRVEFGGGRFVAVGRSGSIQTSINGKDWLTADSGTTNELYDLAYGSGNYVAVGREGTILRSIDGLTWVPCASPTTNRLMCVAFGSGVFVAGGFTTREVFVSTDGVVWQRRSTNLPGPVASAVRWFQGLTFGLGTFLGRAIDSWPSYSFGAGLWQSGNVQVGLSGRDRTDLGGFEVTAQGGLERAYTLQATTNLTDWSDLLVFTNSWAATTFLDTTFSNSPLRFYRAVAR